MEKPHFKRLHLLVKTLGAVIIFSLVIAGFLFTGADGEGEWCHWCDRVSVAQITESVRSAGAWGIAVSIGLMVVHSFIPFPAEFIAVANGMVYGALWGTVITWVGAMLGAYLAFGLARLLGRPFVHRMLTRSKAQLVDEWVARHGGGALLMCRFLPVIAFNLINYAAGLTKISWWTFTWATGLGILPLTALMVIMGDHIEDLPWQVWVLLIAAGLLLWLLAHRLFVPAAASHASSGNKQNGAGGS